MSMRISSSLFTIPRHPRLCQLKRLLSVLKERVLFVSKNVISHGSVLFINSHGSVFAYSQMILAPSNSLPTQNCDSLLISLSLSMF